MKENPGDQQGCGRAGGDPGRVGSGREDTGSLRRACVPALGPQDPLPLA